DNIFGAKSLGHGASLVNADVVALKVNPAINILAAAAVLDSYAREMGIDRGRGLEAWLDP
ncbi:MAG: hypothetical protein GTN93_31250, partial [Anaerolineae bacterium]|nr:hypothetical protein [Anaerolineae bacterium]